MFTGIIEAKVEVIERGNGILKISRPPIYKDLAYGQSIAINGACLTLARFDEDFLEFDVLDETFAKTNLGESKIANTERALKADGRFEGHVVQGHVDGVIKFLRKDGERHYFSKPEGFDQFFVYKGSISLNGVSLTIAEDLDDQFCVALIPHTLELSNLGDLEPEDGINFECDIFAKLLYKWQKK
ncbi:MAG: riboflavin synthase [Candidatus Gracilibacteria bacterium]|jgi:riboflavin synthase|nr:riboflavin synthase [Candidatus Gracilibacteria bacterium]